MKLLKYLNWLLLLAITILACKDGEEVIKRSYPSIDTERVTDINENGATLRAEILNLGNSGVIDHGFIYSLFTSPTLDGSDRISLGETTQKGSFSAIANRNLNKDTKYYVRAYAISKTNFIVYGQQVEFISQGSSAPEISNFDLKEGVIGDTIIITGSGFSNVKTSNQVFFGAIVASVLKATTDSLWCEVPVNTPAGENEISLKVGQSKVTATSRFVLKDLVIASFNPEWITFRELITIKVVNLPRRIEDIDVTVLGKNAQILSFTNNELKVKLSDEVTSLQGNIIIISGSQTVQAHGMINLKPPFIKEIQPIEGKGQSIVNIYGENFNPIASKQVVKFGEYTAEIIEVLTDKITVRLPTGLIDQDVNVFVEAWGQQLLSDSQFHLISPWRKLANFSKESFYCSTWSACGFGYLTLGIMNGNDVWRYDPNSDTWDLVKKFPFETSLYGDLFGQTSFSIGCDGYVGFGTAQNSSNLNIIYKYSSDNNDWQETPLFSPLSSRNHAIGWGINGSGYITFGSVGFFNSPEVTTWKYDYSSNNWSAVADFPGTPPVFNTPTGFAFGDKGYLVTGTTQEFWEYNASSDNWSRLKDFPGQSRIFANSFGINSYGYVIGGSKNLLGNGYAGQGAVKEVWRYDINNQNWIRLEDFPGEARQSAASFVIGDKAYYGVGFGNSLYSDFWEFDPSKL